VDLRRSGIRVTRPRHDLERLVAAHGEPDQACRTQIVERKRFGRTALLVVGFEQSRSRRALLCKTDTPHAFFATTPFLAFGIENQWSRFC
jgi:hypothetical protein